MEVHGKDDADWTLKFHLMLHAVMAWVLFAEELFDEFVQMPNCFALERKHKSAKKNMKDKLNGRSQERSVLESMVLDQVSQLRAIAPHGLINPHNPNRAQSEEQYEDGLVDAKVASEWRAQAGHRFFSGDVVATNAGAVGQILRFVVMQDGCAAARVATWKQRRWGEAVHTGIYDALDPEVRYVPCESLRRAVIHSSRGDARVAIFV